MSIKIFASRYEMTLGEHPNLPMPEEVAERFYGRDPFEDNSDLEGVSYNLLMASSGTRDGHNLVRDSTFLDSMNVDKYVPISPLFVKDLTGRPVYIGFGPERKDNVEWVDYLQYQPADGEPNPFVPLVTFPRFCRDVEAMEGKELLEQVFLTKFRCLEMSMGFYGKISGTGEDDPLVGASYLGANLYPYKLRLDTFYGDGWKLPQTQMVYARGDVYGINPQRAVELGKQLVASWEGRGPGLRYEDWLDNMGDAEIERLYMGGCTIIPTFDACNGFHVVGPKFELEDYWPGRSVLGLHDVVETRPDKAPLGTILEVLEPGFVTAHVVRPAKVIISDGSGYVSPNATDPLPLIPNHNLPHQRTLDDWRATWIPTHPEHFEAPAIWGWEPNNGRFMQLFGPIWDPLHYYYESVDKVLSAFDTTPVNGERPIVPVPEEMENRFYPVVPMMGFDTFSEPTREDRIQRGVKPLSCLKRVETERISAGIGYHPLPAEFEFELDTFWFPELHPLNRDYGDVPAEMNARIVPIVEPKITLSRFLPTLDVPERADWYRDENKLFTPVGDPLRNYPHLARYVMPDTPLEAIIELCPLPYLGDPGEKLGLPAPAWWIDDDGVQLDGPLALEEFIPNISDSLWDVRQKGVDIVKFRHMVYRTNIPLYMLGWWAGWDVNRLQEAFEDWLKVESPVDNIAADI